MSLQQLVLLCLLCLQPLIAVCVCFVCMFLCVCVWGQGHIIPCDQLDVCVGEGVGARESAGTGESSSGRAEEETLPAV